MILDLLAINKQSKASKLIGSPKAIPSNLDLP